jgi:hypothetical protein
MSRFIRLAAPAAPDLLDEALVRAVVVVVSLAVEESTATRHVIRMTRSHMSKTRVAESDSTRTVPCATSFRRFHPSAASHSKNSTRSQCSTPSALWAASVRMREFNGSSIWIPPWSTFPAAYPPARSRSRSTAS